MYPYYFISPFYDKFNIYKPVYDDRVDYQTNAKSYYDYLARYNKELVEIENFINRLLKRDLQVSDTDTINLVKKGNWLSDECCRYDDIIKLQSNVKISSHITLKFLEATKKQYELNNAIQVYSDGLYVPNLLNLITALDNEIVDLQNAIKKINQEITNIYQDIKNINQEITNIKNDITNIYNRLDILQGGGNYKQLVQNTDYKIVMYNDFYMSEEEKNKMYVGIIENNDNVNIKITNDGTKNKLKHDNLSSIKLSHGGTPEEYPESVIFGIRFLGKYEKYNNYVIVNQNGMNLWNVRPLQERASWNATYSVLKNQLNQPFLIMVTSYSDGYNTDFSVYSNNIKLTTGNMVINLELYNDSNEKETEGQEEEGTTWQAGLQEMLSRRNQ